MFKAMTNSLNIPHFLYTDEVGIDSLTGVRSKVNGLLKKSLLGANLPEKLSYMPFFIKAMSIALSEFPLVNSRVILMLLPTSHRLLTDHLTILALPWIPHSVSLFPTSRTSKIFLFWILLKSFPFTTSRSFWKVYFCRPQGGTISISNIGNVGGTYLAPVIVDSQVAIVGIGRSRTIPSYDDKLNVVPKQIINTSWSGDHRVLDGMTMARMADRFKQLLENPELMMLNVR